LRETVYCRKHLPAIHIAEPHAEALGVPLITCDARRARLIGHVAVIELFGMT